MNSYSERFRIVAKKWVAADAAARLLEELKSATFSQRMLKHGNMPVSRAETLVRGSPEWDSYIRDMVNLRTDANLLKVELEDIRMKYWEQQSHNATARAEMRL